MSSIDGASESRATTMGPAAGDSKDGGGINIPRYRVQRIVMRAFSPQVLSAGQG